ncbi:transposase [Streptomyces coeruleorubidus]|uniref:transposase n=1 Tax=Streptomyces coeruleorubidus TaxID=116188 RepID=UPI00368D5092
MVGLQRGAHRHSRTSRTGRSPPTSHSARCQASGTPETMRFATKPAIAARMIGRVLGAGVVMSWVVGAEVYGATRIRGAALKHWHGATSSPSHATIRSPPAQAKSPPTPWSRGSRNGPGRSFPPLAPHGYPQRTCCASGAWHRPWRHGCATLNDGRSSMTWKLSHVASFASFL